MNDTEGLIHRSSLASTRFDFNALEEQRVREERGRGELASSEVSVHTHGPKEVPLTSKSARRLSRSSRSGKSLTKQSSAKLAALGLGTGAFHMEAMQERAMTPNVSGAQLLSMPASQKRPENTNFLYSWN
eukprot:CAMPEP_0206368230 /NCGR_PEP_ID=MMETSP0294-20121207/4552_1 /ASSEMBLY_ACC=CAM_ASM_000327 /TAXON_ID=39354 /ORGANISM="Heterosigma akashiwo, Strain CCMP2393" /LENGTH=129 /DNA_ID=CAMNT_0053814703 /DNA_START=61 /DNA_END=450 /DNA_ORIENTATION=+